MNVSIYVHCLVFGYLLSEHGDAPSICHMFVFARVFVCTIVVVSRRGYDGCLSLSPDDYLLAIDWQGPPVGLQHAYAECRRSVRFLLIS
jgi:hypothetical protein